MREIDRLGFDFVEARIKSQQGEHSSAEKSMLRILDSLQLLDDERIALYMTYHRNRELVHLGKLKEEDSTEYLKRALESGNLRAIIGNLINSILATNASITKGVMIGFLSSKIKELPANVYQQFKDDISDITDFSRWDGILDISLIHLGSRMTDKDMLSYLNAGGFTTPVPSELFDDSDVLNLG